jgi:hypothetical protein
LLPEREPFGSFQTRFSNFRKLLFNLTSKTDDWSSLKMLGENFENELIEYEKIGEKTTKLKLSYSDFICIFSNAARKYKAKASCRTAQLQIIYTLLYYLDINCNDLIMLTSKDLFEFCETGVLPIKKRKKIFHYSLSKNELENISYLKEAVELLFVKCNYSYLGGSLRDPETKIMNYSSFYRMISKDFNNTCKEFFPHKNFTIASFKKYFY